MLFKINDCQRTVGSGAVLPGLSSKGPHGSDKQKRRVMHNLEILESLAVAFPSRAGAIIAVTSTINIDGVTTFTGNSATDGGMTRPRSRSYPTERTLAQNQN